MKASSMSSITRRGAMGAITALFSLSVGGRLLGPWRREEPAAQFVDRTRVLLVDTERGTEDGSSGAFLTLAGALASMRAAEQPVKTARMLIRTRRDGADLASSPFVSTH